MKLELFVGNACTGTTAVTFEETSNEAVFAKNKLFEFLIQFNLWSVMAPLKSTITS